MVRNDLVRDHVASGLSSLIAFRPTKGTPATFFTRSTDVSHIVIPTSLSRLLADIP